LVEVEVITWVKSCPIIQKFLKMYYYN